MFIFFALIRILRVSEDEQIVGGLVDYEINALGFGVGVYGTGCVIVNPNVVH